jgi:PKD repeat protein
MNCSRAIHIVRLGILVIVFLAGVALPQAGAETAPHRASSAAFRSEEPWTIERVDAPRDFSNLGDRSLAFDSAGHAHVAYAGAQLYYASHDGSAWQIETVDSSLGSSDGSPSLALDPAGQPHISYRGGGSLKYARRVGGSWQIEAVAGGGYHPSLVLDAAGQPHISYGTGAVNSELRYAWYDGATWQVMAVDGGGTPSLALDAAGQPHVSYYDDRLKYAWYDGANWHTEIVAVDAGNGGALALDAAGRPRISYSTAGSYQLKYAWHDGVGWRIETVGTGGEGSSLALDAAGRPHISYLDGSALKYAYHDGSAWQTETVIGGDTFHDISLALHPGGRPHIVCYAPSTGDLQHAWYDGTAWQVETVDSSGDAGRYSSLALDATGWPHISFCQYHTYANPYPGLCDSLKYAFFDGDAWQLSTVERGEDVGYDTSLELDPSGWPHISYRSSAGLRHAYFDGSTWRSETVDNSAALGQGTSLALDATGRPQVSYDYDGSVSALKHAWYVGSTWYTEIIEASAVGSYRHSSLALDVFGFPHISYGLYFDSANDSLHYAWYDGVDWHIQTVDSGNGVGGHTSLALDAAGRPHISYSGGNSLKYAWHDGTAWHIQTVETAASGYTSLALDSAGQPHISFYDWGNYRPRYAWYDGTAWHIETVDSTGNVGMYSSLALDAAGRPYISFYDAAWHDLRFAHQCAPLSGVEITGPAVLLMGASGLYTANPIPPNATPPVAFSWDNGTVGRTAVYSWTVPGTYLLTVNAANPCGQAQGSFPVTVVCQPVEGIQVEGPRSLPAGQVGTYQAAVQPISASLPITLTWDNGTVGPTAAYSWTMTGTQTIAVTATNECGEARESLSVTVFCQPVEGIQVEGPRFLPIGQAGTYQALVQPITASLPITLAWDNGTIGPNAVYSWTATGTYTLSVTATNDCSEALGTFSVTVFCHPVTGVDVNGPLSLFVGRAGTYQATVQPITATSPITITWDNGTVGPTATYSWTMTGTYTLTITATNACGTAQGALPVEVIEAPLWSVYLPVIVKDYLPPPCWPVEDAGFAWTPLTPTVGQVVTFTASASGTAPIAFAWDLGDGATATGAIVTHAYIASDTYTVTLEAANACGSEAIARPLTVVCTPPLAVVFAWEPFTPSVGQVVTFTGSASGTLPFTYTWDFGDSSLIVGPLAVVTHSYAASGTYTVTLEVANHCGQALAVSPLAVATPPCQPASILTVTAAISGCAVGFSAGLGGDPPFSYTWDFSPFGSSSAPTPTVDFGASGTYPYTLTVWNCGGLHADSYSGTVTVQCPVCEPVTAAGLAWIPLTPMVGQPVTFSGSATGTLPITLVWGFGDGHTATGQVITHSYAVSGTYTVTMTAANACGQELVSYSLVVVPPPRAMGKPGEGFAPFARPAHTGSASRAQRAPAAGRRTRR